MGAAVDKLMGLVADPERFSFSAEELRETQIAALDERFQDHKERIKLVGLRARDAGVERIERIEDIVPLLLPHTAYKSYPEAFLTGGKWDKLTKWLGTVSALPTDRVDLAGVEDVDQWVEACGRAGLHVSCSSGTTGKSAMLVASADDLAFTGRDAVEAVQWGSAMRVGDKRTPAGAAGAVAYTPRNVATGQAMMAAFVDPDAPRYQSGLPPLTVGSLMDLVVLRKAIGAGTATPDEVAAFEAESARRQAALDAAQAGAVEDIIAKRDKRLYITGMWGALYPLAKAVRDRGFSGKDFHPENGLYMGGGLKRAQLPDDYREFVYETFNLQPPFIYQMYGMQELNSSMPRLREGQRYLVPPWIVPLPLDKAGEQLVDHGNGEVECRAAFFDLSIDGRWGGVISGDRIHIDFTPAAAGARAPSIRDDVARYADLEGDDKIGCAGTVDAYVRGLS